MKGTAKNKWVHGFVIGTFVALYFMVSIISTIHVIDFFKLSNPTWLAISLAVAFEVGAAASLAAIIILEKTSRFMVWSLFLILTLMQAMGNTYYAFINLADYQGWIELFGLVDAEPIAQKRILSIVSGAILPIVALGFIKSLVDYIRPDEPQKIQYTSDDNLDFLGEEPKKKQHRVGVESNVIEEQKEIKIEKEDVVMDDLEDITEGKKLQTGLDAWIDVLEEEEEEEDIIEHEKLLTDKLPREELLQRIPSTHLPKIPLSNEEEIKIKTFGIKPSSLTDERLTFIASNIMLVGSTGDRVKNEQFVPKSEQAKLALTNEEYGYLQTVAGHSETTGITDAAVDYVISKKRLSGISGDVLMEERITERNKDNTPNKYQ